MSEEKLIRIERLIAALDARHIEKPSRARYLQQECGHSVSYWSGLLAGDRSFGEKIARHIEEKLRLPRNYLDQVGISLPAMEVAELFDQMDSHGQRVLTATAHALMRPGTAGPSAERPEPPSPDPNPSLPADRRRLSA